MNKKLKIHDGDTPGKTFEVKIEYPKPKVATMSKNIWHTTDEAPESCADIAFYVDGYLYFASYRSQYNQYGIFGADKVEKWCYVKELSSYILALETELERTRKALDVAVDALDTVRQYYRGTAVVGPYNIAVYCDNKIDKTKEITALKQKDVK